LEHIDGIFNTVQVPPQYNAKLLSPDSIEKKNKKIKSSLSVSPKRNRKLRNRFNNQQLALDGTVTLSFINSHYEITNNTGSSNVTQVLFQTSYAAFSQNDLTTFQNLYNVTKQAAINKDGFDTSDCNANDCVEGNLNTQYTMGIAQVFIFFVFLSSFLFILYFNYN
jgi:hypothetical protein